MQANMAQEGGGKQMNTDLVFDLAEPGMTAWHRAGLIGLVASLSSVREDFGWHAKILGPGRVAFGNVDVSADAMHRVLSALYRLDTDGLIAFPLFGNLNKAPRAEIQSVLMNTFLQHPQSRKAGKTAVVHHRTEDGDEGYRFLPLQDFNHRSRDTCHDLAAAWEMGKRIPLSGWAMPGGVVRHVAVQSSTALQDTPARFFLLLCAPLGCLWHRAQTTLENGDFDPKSQAIVVVPNVKDIKRASAALVDHYQWSNNAADSIRWVAGVSDAALVSALSLSLRQQDAKVTQVTRDLYVVRFGKVAWSKQQVTRTAALSTRIVDGALRNYLRVRGHLVNKPVHGSAFEYVMPMLEQIACNVLEQRPWYLGFADYSLGDRGRRMRRWREGLQKMVQEPELWTDERKRDFVRVMHDAIKNRYGAVSQRASSSGTDIGYALRREAEQLVLKFGHCRTHEALRETLMQFVASSRPRLEGRESTLERDVLMQVFSRRDWRELRDLCLLALATYKGKYADDAINASSDTDDSVGALQEVQDSEIEG